MFIISLNQFVINCSDRDQNQFQNTTRIIILKRGICCPSGPLVASELERTKSWMRSLPPFKSQYPPAKAVFSNKDPINFHNQT